MPDYSQVNDYSAKDLLSTGNPLKLILGSDIDAEFAAIATAVSSKFDSTDIATAGEAQAGVSNTVVITPARLTAWAQNSAGVIEDIHGLSDPDADRIVFWDDSAGAATWLTVGTGLDLTDTTLTVDESALARIVTAGNGLSGGGALSADITLDLDYNELTTATVAAGDLISFADISDSNTVRKMTFSALEAALDVSNLGGGTDMSTVTLTAGSGLSYSSGGTDMTASATIDLDITELTEETTIAPTDDFVVMYDTSASANRKVQADAFLGTELGDGKFYKSTAGTTGAFTEQTIVFDSTEYNNLTRGTFNTSTGEYTVGSDGARILVTSQYRITAGDPGQTIHTEIEKNGVAQVHGGITTVFDGYGAVGIGSSVTTTINCAAGDVIRVRSHARHDDSYSTGASATFVCIVELG